MLRFGLFGITVTVEPFFWLTALLLNSQAFSAGPEMIPDLAAWVFVVLVSVLWHELGHALAFQRFGYRPEIVLQAFGGATSAPGSSKMSRWTDITVTLAGPIFGLGLWAVLTVLQGRGIIPPMNQLPRGGQLIMGYLLMANLFWSILNLIPIYPLDGGRILLALFGPRHLRAALITTIGVGILFCALVAAVYFDPLILLIIVLMTYQNYQRLKATGF
jgi:Zn-dependent protease